MFRNQSCPHYPFLSYNRPVQLKHIQLCPHTHPHPNTHIQRLSLVKNIFLRCLPQFPYTLLDISIAVR
ncbi:unnamed protein product [Hymenolepis diminuta]|uniref:Uncharacterized protein n=1 Tax=Hymenolepis diminuta TaxID=6216 RepID=A0A564YG11_HYMDI|nr:unnamed protein product [Hymenolepis diminuta]